jgi:hypothetical protein
VKLALLVALAACRTQVPAPNDVAVASSSVPVIESPPAPSETVSAAPSATARATSESLGLPASAAAIPADWLACSSDAECVAIRSACCGAWPSNVAHRERVRKSVAVADAARDYCKNRVCAQRMETPACDHAHCVIR